MVTCVAINCTNRSNVMDYSRMTPKMVKDRVRGNPSCLQDVNNLHKNILDDLAPERVIRTRGEGQLVNPRIEKIKKKRDRMLKKYKKTNDKKYLTKCRLLTKSLCRTVKHEFKESFQRKATSPNTKCFWNSVNDLQGKKQRKRLSLNINGVQCEDDTILSNHVASFFDSKIRKLTESMPKTSLPAIGALGKMDYFSEEEILAALKNAKSKMSCGPDGIPMKLVKLFGLASPDIYRSLFNDIIDNGYPNEWKIAKVVLIPKKGNLSDVSNYRPVSNLCSLSKVFERCVLARLVSLPNYSQLIGDHQHGFRKGHSTTTCLMELKDEIANLMDKNKPCLLYSLDLSAAFDMLRVDDFFKKFRNIIPDGLLKILLCQDWR